jgi:hypothetical protein
MLENHELGLYEYEYTVENGVRYAVTVARGEMVSDGKCECPLNHDDKYPMYEATLRIERAGYTVYHGCPDVAMPWEGNELVAGACILSVGEVVSTTIQVAVLQRQMTETLGAIGIGGEGAQHAVVGAMSSDGRPLATVELSIVPRLVELYPELDQVVEQARVSGLEHIPAEEILRVFDTDDIPVCTLPEVPENTLEKVLDILGE